MIIRKVKVTEYEYQAPINYVAGATEPDIQFQLTDYEIPSGATGRVYVGRSDGTFEYTVATISGNNVTVAPTSSMFSVKGPGAIQVTLYVGNEVVKNFAVPVYVHADLADDSAEAGSDVTGVFRAAEEEALADFQEQAEEIVEEVIESIPADYTELTEEVDELNERFGNVENAIETTPAEYSVTNNYYLPIDTLEIGKTYRIGITVGTTGVYGVDVSTNVSISYIVAELFPVTTAFTANETKYVYYTPSSTDEKYLRLTANTVSWNASISQVIKSAELAEAIEGTTNSYGNNGSVSTTFQSSFMNFTACPCKKTTEAGQVTELYIKSYAAGTTKLYVGAVDQLYLFVPRQEFDISVLSGEQTIDVSNMNIYINKGEQILFKFIQQTPFIRGAAGDPEGDNSFYYGWGMQLQVYGAQYAAVFGFGYKVKTNTDTKQDAVIAENSKAIEAVNNNMAVIQSNMNVVSDRNGNKYKMIANNGQIVLLPMDYSHVLCVGNSYTIHPTTTDTESDYRNNLWWGHWAMAVSDKEVAWTSLLQDAIRERSETAVVTPVFGRRYETNPTTYNLDNSNTFTYWDGTQWKSLKTNLSSFSDVDAVVFFLGANYQGNDWYTLYKAMVDKFYEWFPNATIFCCSCSYSAMSAKDADIQSVAIEKGATYISMVGTGSHNKIGSYVKDDSGTLHQINNTAVANHYGDYGQYLILDRICNGIGYVNNAVPLDISLSTISGVTLTLASAKTLEGAVVSVFADVASGTTLTGITVTDADNNSVSVTDHGVTDYGRVFTFIMPDSSVTVVAS